MVSDSTLLCPSANPQDASARVFAVIGGTPTQARASYLDRALPLTADIQALADPVNPAEVFRVAAPCVAMACEHFNASHDSCRLASKTVELAPVVVDRLPRCAIRRDCRWWKQEGAAACRRCPQVVTLDYASSDAMHTAADPLVR